MRTLNLTVNREQFNKILLGEKKEEFREIKPYWQQRLSGKWHPKDHKPVDYKLIKITNGYGKERPTIIAKFDGLRITGLSEKTSLGIGAFFAIKIGQILEITNLK